MLVVYHIDIVILDIDMGYGLMTREMTVSYGHLPYRYGIYRVTLEPYGEGGASVTGGSHLDPVARGLHSSTFQLNLSALYGIGGARRGCEARVKEVLGGVWGVKGRVFLCVRHSSS